jgi:enoyl-[acyl-carrier protein] reductase II
MHPALNTQLCDLLGIERPVVQAGMGFVARSELAAAVSAAGGLGVIGAAFLSLDELREEIRKTKDMTDKPFGVDILFATYGRPSKDPRIEEFTDEVRRQIDVVFEEGVPVLASGLGNPAPVVPEAHKLGIKVISLVGNTKNAKRVAAGGVDVIVAQGYDGGGHTGRVGTLTLVPAVVDCVEQPVMAAGGIADGRGLVAAIAMGAEGTTRTRCFTGKPCRVIKNKTTSEWEGRDADVDPFPIQIATISEYIGENVYESSRLHGRIEIGSCAAGQSSALIHEVKGAGDIVNNIISEADEILNKMITA